MKLIILGSGGATSIPRPGCMCRVCEEARVKGIPYSRSGPSLFIRDVNLLFDTPEEVAVQLNRERIATIDYVFYTHWHPDHTLGLRVVERMNKFWLATFVKGENPWKTVQICALGEVIGDLRAISNKSGSFFDFYEKLNLTKMTVLENAKPIVIRNFEVTPFKVKARRGETSTVYLIQQAGRKVVYAPCDVKPFPSDKGLTDADLFMIGGSFPDGPLKEGIVIPRGSELRRELYSATEILELIRELRAKRTLIVHIEEEWGKSFDEYRELEEKYRAYNIQFAYDGMSVEV
jgi:phosphoribosyl 1,2-cyclic phosphate phosphodiesterase